jgi:hypothetical protein
MSRYPLLQRPDGSAVRLLPEPRPGNGSSGRTSVAVCSPSCSITDECIAPATRKGSSPKAKRGVATRFNIGVPGRLSAPPRRCSQAHFAYQISSRWSATKAACVPAAHLTPLAGSRSRSSSCCGLRHLAVSSGDRWSLLVKPTLISCPSPAEDARAATAPDSAARLSGNLMPD